ncbi:hypothetical protein ORV05_17970 [Amycolatopsis cynarae]|uniref:Histidine phosphatase family protein n=1 Tax=Amycolatopsis cynarae TaxID=2995223 RepID=A0ABY7BEB6_9PSEU|nr:hypothetical protein [Amycolatopsis sp. HUAS 11-8]WAL69577.1 hypothetical protein ORV05_17970 [Amycolatopsis sp. HUAS 11-8]
MTWKTTARTASRRRVLGLTGLASLPVVTGCGAGTGRGKAEAPAPAPEPVHAGDDVVMIVRHAEKPAGTSAPYGITADGVRSEGSLTVRGWTRAGALAGLFAPAGDAPVRAGLARPAAVYAAAPDGDKEQRPLQTVSALAARLGLTVITSHAKGGEAALAAELAVRHGPTLVSWQHEDIPAIADGLGLVSPAPPGSWPGDRFDVVWVFVRSGQGWTFRQVPQLLLDGDRPTVIA